MVMPLVHIHTERTHKYTTAALLLYTVSSVAATDDETNLISALSSTVAIVDFVVTATAKEFVHIVPVQKHT